MSEIVTVEGNNSIVLCPKSMMNILQDWVDKNLLGFEGSEVHDIRIIDDGFEVRLTKRDK